MLGEISHPLPQFSAALAWLSQTCCAVDSELE